MNIDFTGKVCLVTGSSAGIGAAIAVLFSKCGASLVLTGRNEDNLKTVCEKCVEASPQKLQPLMIIGDITKEEDNIRLVDLTIQHFSKLNILVNNAGVAFYGTLTETSMETFDKLMNINLRGMFHVTKLCMPHIIKEKGNIINISSIAGIRSFATINLYATSKAAVDQFTRCTALELAPKGVRVNAVNPGVIKTGIFETGGMSEEEVKQYLEHCKSTHALGRIGDVEEVASSVVFLASDHASFITGVTLSVDGGRHAMCPR